MKTVVDQMRDNLTLEARSFSDIISKTMYTLAEMDNTTRQATTNTQLEILFKFILVLFSGDAAFLRRTSLEILNSLKLRYSRGDDIAIIVIVKTIVQGIVVIM